MRYIIFPYKMGSASARSLRDSLNISPDRSLLVRPNGRYRYRQGDAIINWGNSQIPPWMTNEAVAHTLNKPLFVGTATNKVLTLQRLLSAEIPVVGFTTDRATASSWGGVIYARHKLTGHSGDGIEICDSDNLPSARLYTKGVDNHGEYRVHIFDGEVIDYRKKSRAFDNDPDVGQSQIRTHANGWIYRKDNLRRVERIEELAKNTMTVLGIDFGAVDIIKDGDGNVFVLEVNTAIGLEGSTLTNYVNAIKSHFNS